MGGDLLKLLLPWALLGVGLGYLTAEVMNEHYMRLLVGAISLVFGFQYLFDLRSRASAEHHVGSAGFFGTLAGFTSFSIHAGGPPLTMYLLPKQLPPMVYAGTAGLFFAVVNLTKLPAYYILGQFTEENLLYSLVLVPLAPLGVLLGRRLVKLSNPRFYYRVISVFLVVVGLKLIWDGVSGAS